MTEFLLQSDIKEIVDRLPIDIKEAFAGKRVLITGGCGFVGRYLTATFALMNQEISKPCELVILDNLITAGAYGGNFINSRDAVFIKHDITKPFYPERPVEYIFHAAGIASPYYYRQYPLETLEVATTGLRNILELARGQKDVKVAFFSSSEIYGDPDPQFIPTPESYRGYVSSIGARASYDESKRLGETLIRIFHEKYGVHGTIIRPFNVYAPGMQKTDYRVLPNFAARIVDNQPLQIYGNGRQTRTFCYITDAIDGFIRVLVKGISGEPYNIGNPQPEISMIDLVSLIEKITGTSVEAKVIDYPDSYPGDEPNRRCPDITKAHVQLGYEPKVSLNDGLQRFFSWTMEAYKE